MQIVDSFPLNNASPQESINITHTHTRTQKELNLHDIDSKSFLQRFTEPIARRLKHQGLCHQHQSKHSTFLSSICHSSNYNTYLCISHPKLTIKIIVTSYRHARFRQRLIVSMSQFELEQKPQSQALTLNRTV